jgi:hypothetical protein
MDQESIIKSTTISEVNAHGMYEDSTLFHTMVKLMSRFDELEERMFAAPIASSPHVAYISESALAFSQPQYERLFHYYLDQHGRFVFDNQSKLASSAPKTDRANSGGVSSKLLTRRPYYFDQHGKLILKSQSKLASSASETDKANSGVNIILPTTTYTSNSVRTTRTDDGTVAPHVLLPHFTVLSDSRHQAWFQYLRFHVMPPKLIHKKILIGFGNQKRKN